jgi:carboxymethylenebutenolidase
MACLFAVRHDPDAAVDYHGGDTGRHLGAAHARRAPLRMHLAEEDELIGKAAQIRIKPALEPRPGAPICSDPGRNHAFACHAGTQYDAGAAALADGRTIAFPATHPGLAGASRSG